MLYLLRTADCKTPTFTLDKLEVAAQILYDICSTTLECFIILDDDIKMQNGKEVRGRYTLLETWFPCMPDNKSRGVIFINEDCTFSEMCTVLVHEYSHHLTGEGHDGKLFNLFRDWLRNEFVRRYLKHVERREDQNPD